MAEYRQEDITVTTIADGSATAYTVPISGKLINIIYTKVDYTNGVDFTITAESSGLGIWTELNVDASTTRAPSQVVHDNTGTATSLYDSIILLNDRIKIVLAAGGATKSGQFQVIYEKG